MTVQYYSDMPPQALDFGQTTRYDGDDVISAKALCTFNECRSIRCVLDENRGCLAYEICLGQRPLIETDAQHSSVRWLSQAEGLWGGCR